MQQTLFWGTVVLLCYCGVRYALPCFLPTVLGGALASLLHPAAAKLCGMLGCRYRPCALLVSVVALAGLGLLLWSIGGLLLSQGSALLAGLPQFFEERILPMLGEAEEGFARLAEQIPLLRRTLGADAALSPENALAEAVSSLSGEILGWMGRVIASLPQLLLTCSFTVLAAVLFLQDYARITSFLIRHLPGRILRPMVESKRFLLFSLKKVVGAYLLIMVITFGEISVGLWLLRIPYFAALGFGIALLDILPFIGSGAVLLPWGLYELLVIKNTPLGLGLLLLYALVSAVRFFLEPKIVGGRIGLHPLATVTAMYAGLCAAGVAGLFLAPLFTTLAVHLLRQGFFSGQTKSSP